MKLDRRVLLLAAAAAAAAVVVVVLVVVFGGGNSSTTTLTAPAGTTSTGAGTTNNTEASGLALIEQLFAGIPQQGDTLGKPTAPVTMIVFEDPQCPYCREWNLNTLPTVVDQFVRTGTLKIVYRGIEVIGPNSVPGIKALYGASLQNKLWDLSEALYARQGAENSGWITTPLLRDVAGKLGIDTTALFKAAASPAATKTLEVASAEATQAKVAGTPSFVLYRPPALPEMLPVTSIEPAPFIAALSAAIG